MSKDLWMEEHEAAEEELVEGYSLMFQTRSEYRLWTVDKSAGREARVNAALDKALGKIDSAKSRLAHLGFDEHEIDDMADMAETEAQQMEGTS